MGFKDKYTRDDLIFKENSVLASMKSEELSSMDKDFVKESDKIILSNDAYALGELLEALINTMVNK